MEGFIAPTRHDIETALAHTRDVGSSDRLLVHCHAGKGRSPATAIGVLIAAGASPETASQQVKALRPA